MYFCPVCEAEEWPEIIGCGHADIADTVTLLPCPFCGGPPKPYHQEKRLFLHAPFWRRWLRRDRGTMHIEAYVFCHECGAQSPTADYFLEDGESVGDVLPWLLDRAALLWQARNNRHKTLYEANAERGNNLYPRTIS